jgi:hypothetical protein
MIEFLKECFFIVNLPATILLLLVLCYWLFSLVGFVGIDAFDFDVDVGGDAMQPDSVLKGAAKFFYVGELPIAIVGSFFVLFWWIISMLSNHYLNPQQSVWVMAMWLVPNIFVSLVATKLISIPLAKIFENRDRNINRDELFGKFGRVTTLVVTPQTGQMEIEQGGPPVLLNVRSKAGTQLAKGDLAKIIGYNQQNDTFLVELTKWEKT